jgi:hypothetical protein
VKRADRVTYETIRQAGIAMPGVEEGTSYGTPALKVKGKLFVRLREDEETLVLKTTFDERGELIAADPDTYFLEDHYRPYEYVLVRLSKLHTDAVRDLVGMAYRAALRGKAKAGRR